MKVDGGAERCTAVTRLETLHSRVSLTPLAATEPERSQLGRVEKS